MDDGKGWTSVKQQRRCKWSKSPIDGARWRILKEIERSLDMKLEAIQV